MESAMGLSQAVLGCSQVLPLEAKISNLPATRTLRPVNSTRNQASLRFSTSTLIERSSSNLTRPVSLHLRYYMHRQASFADQ